MSDDQTHIGPPAAAPAGRKPGSVLKAALLLLPTVCLIAGAAWWLHNPGDGGATPSTSHGLAPDAETGTLFHGWPKPDFVLVLSAQMHGYLLPCGCSDPQYGGLERRYNFIESLRKERGWPVVAYDLGDIPQKEGPAKLANLQGLIKYHYSMDALRLMGYAAVSFGEYEAAQPLKDAIDEYALNSDQPAVLAANLLNKGGGKDPLFPDDNAKKAGPDWGKSYVGNWQVTSVVAPDIKVAAAGIIGTHDPKVIAAMVKAKQLPAGVAIPPSVGGQITEMDPKVEFERADKAIPAALAAMDKQKPDFRVLLYQGPLELAKLLAGVAPQFNVIVCISQEDEPPGAPVIVGNTFIVRLGHKGKNIGVVGVNRGKGAGKPFVMRYQLVSMGPQYKTPPGKDNPILAVMEKYTKELKDDDYLSKYGKIPHSTQAAVKGMPKYATAKAGYIGSEACKKCHEYAFKVWAGSDHSHAYKTLTQAKHPSLREYDAECIVCHTVGFRYEGGFRNAKDTPILKDVGCESCHGPCELHKKNPNDMAIRALINPWKAPAGETPQQKEKRQLHIETMCRQCHDSENDVHWRTFLPKWEKVVHDTPADEK
jgi:hypothetical protein